MSKTERSALANPAVLGPVQRMVRRVRINAGALVSRDFGVGRWLPPQDSSGAGADIAFDGEWMGMWWVCRADGFGRPGKYGSGAIFVHDRDGVTLLDDAPNF